jgi:hypothetical protein
MLTLIVANLLVLVLTLALTKYALKRGNSWLTLEGLISIGHLFQAVAFILFAITDIWLKSSTGLGIVLGIYVVAAIASSADWVGFVEYLNTKGIFQLGFKAMANGVSLKFITVIWNPFKIKVLTELSSIDNFGKALEPDVAAQGLGESLSLAGVIVYKKAHVLCSVLAIMALIGMILL